MISQNMEWVVAFNGEVYNYLSLKIYLKQVFHGKLPLILKKQ